MIQKAFELMKRKIEQYEDKTRCIEELNRKIYEIQDVKHLIEEISFTYSGTHIYLSEKVSEKIVDDVVSLLVKVKDEMVKERDEL